MVSTDVGGGIGSTKCMNDMGGGMVGTNGTGGSTNNADGGGGIGRRRGSTEGGALGMRPFGDEEAIGDDGWRWRVVSREELIDGRH